MILAAGDEEQRCASIVVVVDVGIVMAGVDVRQRASPENSARRGDVVTLVQRKGVLLAERVREDIAPLFRCEPNGLVAVRGFLSTGKVALIWDSGTRLTPSVGAELIATPTAPYP